MGPAFSRKYNTAITAGTAQSIKIPMVKRGVVDFAVGADWTPAAGDVKVSKDGGAAANIATLPAAVAMGNTAYWEFVFSAGELSCGTLTVTIADSATKAVEDQAFLIETFGNASALYQADLSLPNLPANVTQLLGTAWLTPGTAGTPDVNAKLSGGTALTGRDLGASVLLSPGTGTGQVDLSSGRVKMVGNVKKNAALTTFMFMMTDSTNHNPVTGKTVTCTRAIDGGAFGAGTLTNVIEVGNGIYAVDFAAADLNGNNIILRATATSADDTFVRIVTEQ